MALPSCSKVLFKPAASAVFSGVTDDKTRFRICEAINPNPKPSPPEVEEPEEPEE